jgi:hypothetical protein
MTSDDYIQPQNRGSVGGRIPENVYVKLQTSFRVEVDSPTTMGLLPIPVPADGNCLWHALIVAKAIHDGEEYDKSKHDKAVESLRHFVVEMHRSFRVYDDYEARLQMRASDEDQNGKSCKTVDEYLKLLFEGRCWADELEIEAAASLLQKVILVLNNVERQKKWFAQIYGTEFFRRGLLVIQRERQHFSPLTVTQEQIMTLYKFFGENHAFHDMSLTVTDEMRALSHTTLTYDRIYSLCVSRPSSFGDGFKYLRMKPVNPKYIGDLRRELSTYTYLHFVDSLNSLLNKIVIVSAVTKKGDAAHHETDVENLFSSSLVVAL